MPNLTYLPIYLRLNVLVYDTQYIHPGPKRQTDQADGIEGRAGSAPHQGYLTRIICPGAEGIMFEPKDFSNPVEQFFRALAH